VFRVSPSLVSGLLFCLVLLGLPVKAGTRAFVHPGVLSSKAELDQVKARLQAAAEPWTSEFVALRHSSLVAAEPLCVRSLDSHGPEAQRTRDDALATYALALLWYLSGEDSYGQRALAHLNAWACFEGFTAGTDQDKLQAGWLGSVLVPAAEIMRLHPGWKSAQIAALQSMFRRVFYPQLETPSPWNGNVDLTQTDAWLAIAVFNEDEQAFDSAVRRFQRRLPAYIYLRSDGPLPPSIDGDGGDVTKFWFSPRRWVDGLTQETCRDNGHHSQFGLGSALHIAETAWHQGLDLYTPNQARLAAAMELLASELLSGSMQGLSSRDEASASRFDTWEIGLNHYETRAGIKLPKTHQLVTEQIRPRATRASCNLCFETLTHGDLPHEAP